MSMGIWYSVPGLLSTAPGAGPVGWTGPAGGAADAAPYRSPTAIASITATAPSASSPAYSGITNRSQRS